MSARFVRERRCVICDHRVHEVPDRRPPAQWDSQCDEGCECTTAHCQPYRVYADGTTDRRDMGPFGTSNQQEQQMTTPQQPYQAPSADDFLMGGGGAPSASFLTVGTTVSGRITERPTVQQQRDMKTGENKFWPDGNPMMQLVVTVQTDQFDPAIAEDDGRRRIFVKNQMKNAVADAVRGAGARGLEVGGALSITFTHELPPKQRGFNPLKQYSASYTPAAVTALHTPDPGSLPPQQYAAAPAAPQQYTPAPAPAPQQYTAPAPPAEQLANPAVAALVAQQQAQAAATPPLSPPPF